MPMKSASEWAAEWTKEMDLPDENFVVAFLRRVQVNVAEAQRESDAQALHDRGESCATVWLNPLVTRKPE